MFATREVSYFDSRFVLLLVVNVFKSEVATPWKWDPFNLATTQISFFKWLILAAFSLSFSFIAIGIPYSRPHNNSMRFIRVQIKEFSSCLTISFLASLFMPQILFWYYYPVILLFFLCYTRISNVFRSFVFWIEAVPDVSIFITATTDTIQAANIEVEEGGEELEGANIEEGEELV
ncbi:hypothetical protein BUALT_Bualt10G0084600 [Buddleja alternifolia]|uniref:Uncharacterized protein n=1 Tax=Buddleja alternifolia TaxID=168488 RepID=A0AAV6X4C4_9LAMI|nr:hypothetical protein BUALT_Bualt10G0084600 [Buddleja alternifolia]